MKRPMIAALFAACLVSGPALAHEFSVGDLTIGHPMTHPTSVHAMSAVGYLSITNNGTVPDRLIGVAGDFPTVSLHGTENTDGIMRMFSVDAIDIPAGETVLLAPGGMHIMFIGLNGDPFEIGEKIPAVLTFEKAGTAAVDFNVEERNHTSKGETEHKHAH